jgi:two-component system response regulator WspF
MRVGIVNDMQTVTEALRRIVLSDSRYTVAWTARDGAEAVRRCVRDTPDVVLMDLVMPGMTGAEATREIMQQAPCAILVVTSSVVANFRLVCEALGYGAYDSVETPTLGSQSLAEAGAPLLTKLARYDRVNQQLRGGFRQAASGSAPAKPFAPAPPAASVAGGGRAPAAARGAPPTVAAGPAAQSPAARAAPSSSAMPPIVAIGSSTGGPAALGTILSALPATLPAAVLIAQHVGLEFTAPLAQWLGDRSRLKVQLATPGQYVEPGRVLIANTEDHMIVAGDGTIRYTRDPVECPYRPSVDALFHSLANGNCRPGVAVLLTGIGNDGAQGLLHLRQAGWYTIAQDRATSVVYGMPQAAANLGAACRILPLGSIAGSIDDRLRRSLSATT